MHLFTINRHTVNKNNVKYLWKCDICENTNKYLINLDNINKFCISCNKITVQKKIKKEN